MSIKQVQFSIEGVAPLSFSKKIQSEKGEGESHDAFEQRTWKERLHVGSDGYVFIPPMMMKKCVEACAKFMSETVQGKGKATWTKHFKAGILCTEPLSLGVRPEEINGEWLFVPSNGQAGGGTRVNKCFPYIEPPWTAKGQFILLDVALQEKRGLEKLEQYLRQAGQFIGLGRFAPRNGGFYGRYKVTSFDVMEG